MLKHNKKELYRLLVEEFSDLPKVENLDHDNYAVVNVAPSVVPTYLPSFRIFVYNHTGEAYDPGHLGVDAQPGRSRSMKDVAGALCDDPEYADTWRCHLTEPWHSDPRSPSRTNALWTPLGYAQVRLGFVGSSYQDRLNIDRLIYCSTIFRAWTRPTRGMGRSSSSNT